MVFIQSKDVTIIIIGLIISIGVALLPMSVDRIDFDSIYTIYAIILIIFIFIVLIIWASNSKISEIKERLEIQEIETKKLSERLKIHQQLIDMKAEIKEIQKKVFK